MAKTKKKLIAPVRSLAELRNLAAQDPLYTKLLLISARNLGGPETATVSEALRWLEVNASETSEEGVIGEVNFCRDLV